MAATMPPNHEPHEADNGQANFTGGGRGLLTVGGPPAVLGAHHDLEMLAQTGHVPKPPVVVGPGRPSPPVLGDDYDRGF